MPFLHNAYIREELEYFDKVDCEALVPRIGALIEPLHAIYRKDLRDKVSGFIKTSGDHSIKSFLKTIGTAYWDLEDNLLHRKIFKNLNTEEDLREAKK